MTIVSHAQPAVLTCYGVARPGHCIYIHVCSKGLIDCSLACRTVPPRGNMAVIAGGETDNVYTAVFYFTLVYSSGRPRHSFWNMAGLTICDLRLEQFRGDEGTTDGQCHTGRAQPDTATTPTHHG